MRSQAEVDAAEAQEALAERAKLVRSSAGLDDAIRILIKISKEYQRFCDVMLTMPERRNELKAGSRFMDSLEKLRDELLKRKSSNAPHEPRGAKNDNREFANQQSKTK